MDIHDDPFAHWQVIPDALEQRIQILSAGGRHRLVPSAVPHVE
ncbi:hypothetical protein [Actinoallomurus acanthiterrae]